VRNATSATAQLAQRLTLAINGTRTQSQPNEFLVLVDGKPMPSPECPHCTFSTAGCGNNTPTSYTLFTGLDPAHNHDIRLVKITEPEWNDENPTPNWITFHGLTLDAGNVDQPHSQPRTRRIEFIGDSITAGYCNLCEGDQLGDGPAQQSFFKSWPSLICEELQAECSTIAWSGMGLIHNCCGGFVNMPAVWPRTVATDDASHWDFSWKPDAVVINLGTNDGTYAQKPEYTDAYLDLVRKINKAYAGKATFFLACGPMSDAYCPQVDNVLATIKSEGIRGEFLDQRGFLNGTFGPACCGHPSAQVDVAMAASGAAALARGLGWDSVLV